MGGIRRDHVARYEFAADILDGEQWVVDFACGIGYGAAILADAGHVVVGIDRSREAIDYGRLHYEGLGAELQCGEVDALWKMQPDSYDAAICFETIEHLADPLLALLALKKIAPVLIASVPNETMFPFKNYEFHHRHYTRDQFFELLREAGYSVRGVYGQAGPHSDVEPGLEGRTLIVVADRVDEQKPDAEAFGDAVRKLARDHPSPDPDAGGYCVPDPEAVFKEAAAAAPAHVTILGLGPSVTAYLELTKRLGGRGAYSDEVWGINAIGDVIRCDRIFHMDDVQIQQMRAEANPDGNIAAMLPWLKRQAGPIYTSVVRPGYSGMVAYPLEDVLNGGYDTNGGAPYFNSTAPYAIAYAIHIGVKRISLFGLDYTMEDVHSAEKGRGCCEFWLGVAAARGIQITLPEQTSLLDACTDDRERLYGYDCVNVCLTDRPDGGLAVTFKDREDLPTGEEMEARYDHKHHPNPLMKRNTP